MATACSRHEDDDAADGTFGEETWRHPQQRAERSRPHGARTGGVELVIRRINGHAKQKTTVDAVGSAEKAAVGKVG